MERVPTKEMHKGENIIFHGLLGVMIGHSKIKDGRMFLYKQEEGLRRIFSFPPFFFDKLGLFFFLRKRFSCIEPMYFDMPL